MNAVNYKLLKNSSNLNELSNELKGYEFDIYIKAMMYNTLLRT